MDAWLSRYEGVFYALLRIMAGSMFAFHGVQKVLGLLVEFPPPQMGTQLWFGGVIELVAGLLILVGFQTRWAAFLASGEMAMAYFQFHWRFQLGAQFFPGINKGELAVLYCFVFLLIFSRGSGIWSLDGLCPDRKTGTQNDPSRH